MQEERQKNIEVSIVEKLELEEKIRKAEANQRGDHSYIQDMEIQLHKAKQDNIILQTECKKLEIKYDEELYNKKWNNANSHNEYLQRTVQDMEN